MTEAFHELDTNLHKLDQPLSLESQEERSHTLREGAKDAVREAADMMRLWSYLDEIRIRDCVVNFSDNPHLQQFENKARLRHKAFSGDSGSSKEDLEKLDGDIEEYCMQYEVKIDEKNIEDKVRTLLYGEKNELGTSEIMDYIRTEIAGITNSGIVIQPQAEAEFEVDELFEHLYGWLSTEMEIVHMEGEDIARLCFKLEALEEQGVHLDIENDPTFKRIIRIITQRDTSRSGFDGIDMDIKALTSALHQETKKLGISAESIPEGVKSLLLTGNEY
ncbi:MAG: hypothetical protein R3B71_00440 [Candidatus Gracilibacteria bacterium]